MNKPEDMSIGDYWIECVIAVARGTLVEMTEAQRIDLMARIQEGYCPYCGKKTDTVCHCMNDE